jgi:MYXO-CTERM domain-containing protein
MGTLALAAFAANAAHASTGVCDSNPPTTSQACIDAIQAANGVVNDIFRDVNGKTATQLPIYGQLVNVWPAACLNANTAGCDPGTDTSPYDCPGEYSCVSHTTALFTSVASAVNALDHTWGHPCRLVDHTLDANGCPNFTNTNCVSDGTTGSYNPWEGFVFDLGGPSNQVAIFAMNDHGPQPCESLEYTIFLTDNPQSKEIILSPTTTGADPNKWNRAVLKKVFTDGWFETRQPDPAGHGASCGDTAQYSVENDSMTQVFGLPCGINFRYAALVAGNDGLDFPACNYDSSEAEVDAIAGLTESGAAVCPDADHDGYVACTCSGAPPVCDCDDTDPQTHPGAPESCDATKDYNCNGHHPEPCAPGLDCYQSICIPECMGVEFTGCPSGSTCQDVDTGMRLCVPNDCTTGGCPPGSTCDAQTKTCKPACDNVVCPHGQHCVTGQCVDPCSTAKCQVGFTCVDGVCQPPCNCFAGDVGCTNGEKCDRTNDAGMGTNLCVPPGCIGMTCPSGSFCEQPDGGPAACLGECAGVMCPPGQVCVEPDAGAGGGCVNLCTGVVCPANEVCDPMTGGCKPGSSTGGDGGLLSPDAGRPGGPDGSAGGGADGGPGGNNEQPSGQSSGCGCSTVGAPSFGTAFLGVLTSLGLALALLGRRRRR